MSGIKGIVILTRFDFIENNFGRDGLKAIFEGIAFEDYETLRQPVIISKDYPEKILSAIDQAMLKEFFNNNVSEFQKLGHWNARHLLPRYSQIYMDEQNPGGFLRQMARMRSILIGLGEMHITAFEPRTFGVHISYGQPYTPAVKLSEWGYLEEGCRMCGAQELSGKELKSTETSVEYQIGWNKP